MSEAVLLTPQEIKEIIKDVPKSYKLEIYRSLRTCKFSSKITANDLKKIKKDINALMKTPNLPRVLTDQEVEDILKDLPPIMATIDVITQDNHRQLLQRLTRQLKSVKFTVGKNTITDIKATIREQYLKSICPPGESVGVNSAVSIGQPLTQANLNTFHQAGSKNSNKGTLSDIKKFFMASKPKHDVIITHLVDKNLTREEIEIKAGSLMGVTVDTLLKSNTVILDAIPEEDEYWYHNYKLVHGSNFEYKGNKFLRVFLNLNACYKYDIFIEQIARTIEKSARASEFKQLVKCITSSTVQGIIDIHVEPEFIKTYLNNYVEKSKSNIILSGNLNEHIEIFLTDIFQSNFKNMMISGISNIDYISYSEGIQLNKTYREIPVVSEVALEKYSSAPYNLKIEDVSRLWYIRVHKNFIYFDGITPEKYVQFFESAGIKIIENNLDTINLELVVLLPKKIEVDYFDENDGDKIKPLYSVDENGFLVNNKLNTLVTNLNPIEYIQSKLTFIENKLFRDLNKSLKTGDNLSTDIFMNLDPLYKYGYYYYVIIEGKLGITKDILNHNMVDERYTHPDNVWGVYNTFGIEATRYFLYNKYTNNSTTEKINPINLEMLVDFQTSLGVPLPISFQGISKSTSGLLSSVSFEHSMETFQQGSSIGTVDDIKGVSGSIMVGTKCKNGSGFTRVEFDSAYLQDKDNLNNEDDIKNIEVETDYLVGTCDSTGPRDMRNDFNADDLEDIIPADINKQGKVSELGPKEMIPDPPRMEAPKSIKDMLAEVEIDLDTEAKGPVMDTDKLIDFDEIPDDPGALDGDFF